MRKDVFALSIIGVLAMTGCASKPSPPVAAADEPSCYGVPYASVKSGPPVSTSGIYGAKPVDADALDQPPKIIVEDKPLERPPEITRIERGMTTHFVGGYINDGLESWTGVDLDRLEAILVTRRIHDKRATLTRPFKDPVFNRFSQGLVVRKWSDDERVEMEIVSRTRLGRDQATSFICVANGIWAAAPNKRKSWVSDSLAAEASLEAIAGKPDSRRGLNEPAGAGLG